MIFQVYCRRRADRDGRVEIAILCRDIWKARNDLLWNQKHTQVNVVVVSAKQHLMQWRNFQSWSLKALLHNQVEADEAEKWVKPHVDTIKVIADAEMFTEQSAYNFGLITRDCNGALMKAKTGSKQGYVSGDFAEAMAIKETVSWIKENEWPRVHLEPDSLVIIQAIGSVNYE